jgi:parallel beta-helix repeat protein
LDKLERLFVSLLMIAVFSSNLFSYKGFVSAGPPLSGDWVVNGTETYHDEVIVLNGNLIVEDGGNLTFRRVTLKMNCTYEGQHNIMIKYGGKFCVLEGSVITSSDLNKRIGEFIVEGTFRMNNSELHGCGWADAPGAWGLIIRSDDAIVENSLISYNFRVNINSDGVVVRNNNITENDHHGVFAWDSSPTICDNNITMNGVDGIEVDYGSPTVCGNMITSNDVGIAFSHVTNAVIEDNTITLNDGEGISCHENCSVTIQSNNVTSNSGWGGIVLKADVQGIIQGNIVANDSEGIHLDDNCSPLIQGNIIKSNRRGVICGGNSQPEIHRNDIYDNENFDVANDDPSVTVNATYNYWADEPNPEKISQNVLYNPWLTESVVPLIEITNPLSSDTVSSMVTVSTEVDAPNGDHGVEFYIDDELRYTDYEAPYEWNWDTTQYTETEHKVTAEAHDEFGLKSSTSIAVFVDNTAPTVTIIEPAQQNAYCGTVSVSVNATDNREISNVHVKVDTTEWLVMTYDEADLLWKYDLNTTLLSDGEHTLMTLALDKASNPATASTTIITDNSPPTLTIQAPQNGMTVGLTLLVKVQASDEAGISRIEFYLQDVLVCTLYEAPHQWSWDTTQYPNGQYTITTKAYDNVGNAKTSQVQVTVNNIESPWWQTQFWTIVQVLIAVGGLIVAVLAYLTRTKKGKKKK